MQEKEWLEQGVWVLSRDGAKVNSVPWQKSGEGDTGVGEEADSGGP